MGQFQSHNDLEIELSFYSNFSNACKKFDGKKKIDLFHQDSKIVFQEDAQLKARFMMIEIHKKL
jgi:hypothetical protein